MGYLSKKGYVLRKDNLTTDEINAIKIELTARPLVDNKFAKITDTSTFPAYIETKNKLYVPKMYGINKFGLPSSTLPDYIGKDWDREISFTGTLYDRQLKPAEALLNACQKNGGGILQLGTGFGKTITFLYVLSQLKCKAIIVVNKIPLLQQWQIEISKFLPHASIGIIQGQKNVDVNDKDIVIAMLQSLAKIDYPDALFNEFKLTLIDEVHNTASTLFSKVLFKLCSKYTIGLSATPNRADGCEYVFMWHLGDIVYKSDVVRKGKTPIVRHIKINSNDYKEVVSVNKYTSQSTIQFSGMLTDLITMEKRNKLIVELIKKYCSENRKILVLSERRNHLIELRNNLNLDNVPFTYGLFVGSMKIQELEKSKNCNVILATYAAFSEGVSVKDLDTLILTTPKKFIGHLKNTKKKESGKLEQIVGRIFRKEHTTNHPLIVDLQDNFSVYKNQSNGRKKFYKEHFTNAIFEEQFINLDEYTKDNILVSNLQTKKRKEIVLQDTRDACVIEDC